MGTEKASKEDTNKSYTPSAKNTSRSLSRSLVKPFAQSLVQPKATAITGPLKKSSSEKETTDTISSKSAMPEEVQAKMENSFGQDFSNVNIHKDSTSAQDINAKAYTQGTDIHFAPGEYNPSSKEGQELIGHELTHVVQQGQGKVGSGEVHGKGLTINQNPTLEKEADEAGKLASEGKSVEVNGNASGIQRKEDYSFEHRVLKNETLLTIAVYYGVTTEKIRAANRFAADYEPEAGKVITIPAPDKSDKEKLATKTPPEKDANQPDLLGLVDQKNQVMKVTADDFESFLLMYNKFNSAAVAAGIVPPAKLADMKDLTYLLGPLQDQNPQIKQYIDKAQTKLNHNKDKVLQFIKELWNGGFLGKLAITIPGVAAVTVAGITTAKSVQLTMAGQNTTFNDENIKAIDALIDKIEFKHESKNYSGNVTPDSFQEKIDLTAKTNVNNVESTVTVEEKFKKVVDENDRKALDEAKFDDKSVWYSTEKDNYYDTITLRHFIHQGADKIPATSSVIKTEDIMTVSSMIQSVNDAEKAKAMKFYHLKDKHIYTYAQIVTMYTTKAMDRKEEIADVNQVQTITKVDVLAGEKLYADDKMVVAAGLSGGVGFNTGNKGLNYKYGGSLGLTFPGAKSDKFLSFEYNQDKHYNLLGNNLNQWSESFAHNLLFKIGANYKFDMGDFQTKLGTNISYKIGSETDTNKTTGVVDQKNEKVLSFSPYVTIDLDEKRTKMQLTISPEFMYQDNKFKSALNVGLTGLKLSKNSFIKVDLKINNNKIEKAQFTLFYLIH